MQGLCNLAPVSCRLVALARGRRRGVHHWEDSQAACKLTAAAWRPRRCCPTIRPIPQARSSSERARYSHITRASVFECRPNALFLFPGAATSSDALGDSYDDDSIIVEDDIVIEPPDYYKVRAPPATPSATLPVVPTFLPSFTLPSPLSTTPNPLI